MADRWIVELDGDRVGRFAGVEHQAALVLRPLLDRRGFDEGIEHRRIIGFDEVAIADTVWKMVGAQIVPDDHPVQFQLLEPIAIAQIEDDDFLVLTGGARVGRDIVGAFMGRRGGGVNQERCV